MTVGLSERSRDEPGDNAGPGHDLVQKAIGRCLVVRSGLNGKLLGCWHASSLSLELRLRKGCVRVNVWIERKSWW